MQSSWKSHPFPEILGSRTPCGIPRTNFQVRLFIFISGAGGRGYLMTCHMILERISQKVPRWDLSMPPANPDDRHTFSILLVKMFSLHTCTHTHLCMYPFRLVRDLDSGPLCEKMPSPVLASEKLLPHRPETTPRRVSLSASFQALHSLPPLRNPSNVLSSVFLDYRWSIFSLLRRTYLLQRSFESLPFY